MFQVREGWLASTLLTEPEEPSLCRRLGVRGYTVELGLMICLPATAVGSHYAGRAACRSFVGFLEFNEPRSLYWTPP